MRHPERVQKKKRLDQKQNHVTLRLQRVQSEQSYVSVNRKTRERQDSSLSSENGDKAVTNCQSLPPQTDDKAVTM